MSPRPTDPAIALARQAARGRRVVELRTMLDQLDTQVNRLNRRAATVAARRDRGQITPTDAARALDDLHRRRVHTVAAIDTRLRELDRLRKEGVR